MMKMIIMMTARLSVDDPINIEAYRASVSRVKIKSCSFEYNIERLSDKHSGSLHL